MKKMTADRSPYGKNVFVTGASSGIGKACAEAFAAAGFHVVGVSRHIEEDERLFEGGGSLRTMPMDVTDAEAVHRVVSGMEQVDIAVLCAGMGVAGPAEELPMDLARLQMEVNYFGVLQVASEILPRMREQGKGLFMVMSSIAGKVPIPMQCHYSSSKYALEAYVEAVRMEMKPFGVRAVLLEPGDTKTGFTASRQSNVREDSPYAGICRTSVARMEKDEQNGRPPESASDVALRMSMRRNPPVRVAIGFEYKLLMFILRLVPDRMKSWILGLMYLPGWKG
ncbi:MAG: SDR family NAD(P)-dependent oxidoreductase [Firmicutes bacterium]|nr:SDR family NAD(P)-dependent oxidoreductase [Bacillota bacterium]